MPFPPFSCTFSPNIPELLSDLNCSLVVSTYQAGKVITLSPNREKDSLTQLARTFDTPMGMALQGDRLALASKTEVTVFANDIRLSGRYPQKPNTYDAMLVPRAKYYTGQVAMHDMAWCDDGLVGVNTAFSCLCKMSQDYSFEPVWVPPYISELVAEDRCHLNGMAVRAGKPKYVSMFSATDTQRGWDKTKSESGQVLDVTNNEKVIGGLFMPHSPRIFNDKLYLLLSGTGEVVQVDTGKGTYDVIQRLPGFVRGLDCYGDYLFVGLSRVRKNHTFSDLPIAKKELICGIAVIHLPSGSVVGQIQYQSSCEELYDVLILPGYQRPNILNTKDKTHLLSLSLPQSSFWATIPEN
ncbi:TIGR03032 family protein [bacterium]|nr:TIGR03032 family protein [bacterium]